MWCQKVDLDVGAVIRRGRDICKPAGKLVRPSGERATGKEKKEVKGTTVGREQWKALKRDSMWVGQIKRE
jgi:hypothetical protein